MILGTVGVRNLKVTCIIGVLPHERQTEQTLEVDVHLEVNYAPCISSDNVEDATDYRELAEIVARVAKEGKYRLVETLAWNVMEVIAKRLKPLFAKVQIRKPSAFENGAIAIVEIERRMPG